MRKVTFSIGVLIVSIIIGCSNSSSVTQPDEMALSVENSGNHIIAAMGTIILDSSSKMIIEPVRDAAFHFNVTSFLSSACPGGCIDIAILDITGEIWTIKITIENPTSILVYDVRIIYYNTSGKTVMNPDGLIDLYSKPVSPFTAFAKEYPNRAFPVGPGGTDSEELILKWSPGAPAYVAYLVDVSVGGNCDEPYAIDADISNPIPESGGSATISAVVSDWQDDNTECYCNWASLGGFNQQMPQVGSGTGFRIFELEIDVPGGYTPGEYLFLLKALEYKPKELHLYQILKATVIETGAQKISDDGVNTYLNFTSKTVGAFDDNVYVAWVDDSTAPGPQVFLKERRDGTWLDKVHVSQSTAIQQSWEDPSIAINAQTGDLHFLWAGYEAGDKKLCYRARKSDVWGTIQTLFQSVFCLDSQIDVENNGEIHVVFQDADGPFLCLYWIHDPGTGTFESPYILAEALWPGDPYYAPAIDHDSAGYVHVPFMTGAGGANNIGYKMYNGTSWSGLWWLTSDSNSYYPDITVAPNRKATMIYCKDDGDLWMKAWTGSWEVGEHQVTSGASMYGVPNCDSDVDGNIHLAYSGESDSDRDIYYTVGDSVSGEWSAPINLSDNASESKDPALFVDTDNRVHIVWSDNADGKYGVYYVEM